MKLHGNARTCPKSRRLLVDRLEGEWSLTEAAEADLQSRLSVPCRRLCANEGELPEVPVRICNFTLDPQAKPTELEPRDPESAGCVIEVRGG
jgi:hypothetical protein